MAPETIPIPREQVANWLTEELHKRNTAAMVHTERIRPEQVWLRVPVYIQGILNNMSEERGYLEYIGTTARTVFVQGELDAHDRASILQEVEDAWNDREPPPEWKLLLIPAAN